MSSATEIDWSEFPAGTDQSYDPARVAPAIDALKSVSSEAESGQPFHNVLWSIANIHGGYLYPASYAAVPVIGDVLELPGWPRSTALAVLVELAYFYVPDVFTYRGQEIDFRAATHRNFEALRERVQEIADGSDDGAGSCKAAHELLVALDDRAAGRMAT